MHQLVTSLENRTFKLIQTTLFVQFESTQSSYTRLQSSSTWEEAVFSPSCIWGLSQVKAFLKVVKGSNQSPRGRNTPSMIIVMHHDHDGLFMEGLPEVRLSGLFSHL